MMLRKLRERHASPASPPLPGSFIATERPAISLNSRRAKPLFRQRRASARRLKASFVPPTPRITLLPAAPLSKPKLPILL